MTEDAVTLLDTSSDSVDVNVDVRIPSPAQNADSSRNSGCARYINAFTRSGGAVILLFVAAGARVTSSLWRCSANALEEVYNREDDDEVEDLYG